FCCPFRGVTSDTNQKMRGAAEIPSISQRMNEDVEISPTGPGTDPGTAGRSPAQALVQAVYAILSGCIYWLSDHVPDPQELQHCAERHDPGVRSLHDRAWHDWPWLLHHLRGGQDGRLLLCRWQEHQAVPAADADPLRPVHAGLQCQHGRHGFQPLLHDLLLCPERLLPELW